ncbi:MAG TPA: twin-arginine translocase subunit TatC, partial [Thermoplasmata archaeon]|nr:twin-arginine translocase subunit TatC [Thermoplasmata archaeon]
MKGLERVLRIVEEARHRLIRVVLVLGPLFGFLITFQLRSLPVALAGITIPLAYPYPNLFDNITAQLFRALVGWMLPHGVTLLNVGVGDSVVVQMEIGALLTVILGMPWLVHEAAQFLVPALRQSERQLARRVGIPATLLFALGTGVALAWITPLTFNLLFRYV